MARGGLTVNGADKLVGKLKRNANLNDVKNVVKMNGSELERRMKRKAVFTKGYSVGATKRSIQNSIEDNGFTARVRPTTHYSYYLEKGTRFMEAQPFVGPAFYEQKEIFKRDMKRLMR